MLVLDDSGIGGLPVGVVHHGVALEIGGVQHLRLKADGTVRQLAKLEAEIGIDGTGVDNFIRQSVPMGFVSQIVCIQPNFDSIEHLFDHPGVAANGDALVSGGEVIVVVGMRTGRRRMINDGNSRQGRPHCFSV